MSVDVAEIPTQSVDDAWCVADELTEDQPNADPREAAETFNPTAHGIITWNALERLANDKPKWLIKDLIPQNSSVFILGEWGQGKSPFVVQMLIELALGGGRKFLGLFNVPEDPARVLYIDYENSIHGIQEYGGQISKALGISRPPDNFHLRGANYLPDDSSTMNSVNELLDAVSLGGYHIVVADPIRGLDPEFEDSNKNAAQRWNQIRQAAARSGTTTVLVHHVRKYDSNSGKPLPSIEQDPDGFIRMSAGASAIYTGCQVRILFQRKAEDHSIIRVFRKGGGWGPVIHLTTLFDDNGDPMAFRIREGIDSLTPLELERFKRLPRGRDISTGEIRSQYWLVQGKAMATGQANTLLGTLVASGLVLKVRRGFWRVAEGPWNEGNN